MSVLTLEAKLERTDANTQWGFRMQGGKDFSSPLTIQRVNPGSLAAKCGLQAGDIILKIGNIETENLVHKKAQEAILSYGNRLDLLLQRLRKQKSPRGGGGGVPIPTYEKFQAPAPAPSPMGINYAQNTQNFNTAPKPFGAPQPFSSNIESVTQKTQNISINSQPTFQGTAQKYTDQEEAPNPASHQSRSFKYLQDLIEAGHDEPPQVDMSEPLPPWKGGTMPPAAPSTSPKNAPWQPPAPKAPPQRAPPPPPAAKPWAPSAPPAPPAAPVAPMGGPRPAAPPARPTGTGAIRGKRGDAVFKQQDSAVTRTPMCASCGTFIRGPFVVALGKTWCPDHFVCANARCGVKLIDIGFVEENGQLYCEKDYEMYFAPHCFKCSKAIVGECVNALQRSYHPGCFLCIKCKKPIGGNQFHIEEGEPYCEADWAAEFQTMCSGCNYPIEPGDKWVEAMNRNFHSECFNCSTCQVNLEGAPFFVKGGKQYCKKHAR